MNDHLEIILTDDGSHTLRSQHFGSTYHSTQGALTESRHIYIDAGLRYLYNKRKGAIHILETGFGTGLNALLSLIYAKKNKVHIHYTGLEKYRIGKQIAMQLNYLELLDEKDLRDDFLNMHKQESGEKIKLNDNFDFVLYPEDLLKFNYPSKCYDLIFFDTFEYDAQAEFWGEEFLDKMYKTLKNGGVLITYGAKGSFKRALRSVGFEIEALPGPPGKREITRGLKI